MCACTHTRMHTCTHACPHACTHACAACTKVSYVGTLYLMFTYDSPILSEFNRPNIPSTTTESFTVLGLHFGAVDETATFGLCPSMWIDFIWAVRITF